MALTDNLVSYWKLDESSGNATDSVGSNTWVNSNVTYSAGKINNGAVFNWSSSKLSITPYNSTTKTISLWAKNTSAPSSWNQQSMWCEALNSSAGIQDIAYINDWWTLKITASIYLWTTTASYTHTMWTDWHHIVMTINWTSYTLYVDWVSVATGVSNVSTTYWTYWTIGAYRDSNNPSWIRWRNGSIDEVWIRSRALSSTEIEELYNNGDWLQYPFSTWTTFTPKIIQF